LFASFRVAYRFAKCKKLHSSVESLLLPAAVDVAETMLRASYAK